MVAARRGELSLTRLELSTILTQLASMVRRQLLGSPQALATFARERLLLEAVVAEAQSQSRATQPEIAQKIDEARKSIILQTCLASKASVDPAFPSEADVARAHEADKDLLLPRSYFMLRKSSYLLLQTLVPRTPRLYANTFWIFEIKRSIRTRTSGVGARELVGKGPRCKRKGCRLGPQTRHTAHCPGGRAQLEDGGVSQPIRMAAGWHLIKILGTKSAGQVSMMDAKSHFIQGLRQAGCKPRLRTIWI